VSTQFAALTLIIGASLLAGWVALRFPGLTPASAIGVALHMGCSLLAVEIAMNVLGSAPRELLPIFAALFGAALPATTYMLLSAFWILRFLAGAISRAIP